MALTILEKQFYQASKDASIEFVEKQVQEIKTYTDEQIQETKDWATETFKEKGE